MKKKQIIKKSKRGKGRGREIACSECAAHEKRLAFSIFVSLFWLFGSLTAWSTDTLHHPLPPCFPRGMAWYILNIVPCKDGARWHYFDIYLHLAAASFSPFCISNDPQLSFVDWLCSLSVPLFLLLFFVSGILLLCAAMRSRKAKLIFSPHIQHILEEVLYMIYTFVCFIYVYTQSMHMSCLL